MTFFYKGLTYQSVLLLGCAISSSVELLFMRSSQNTQSANISSAGFSIEMAQIENSVPLLFQENTPLKVGRKIAYLNIYITFMLE